MGTIKDRNGMDVTEAETIKRWEEYMDEPCTKDLHDPIKHDGVILHLRPRCPGMQSLVGLREHNYKQSSWR